MGDDVIRAERPSWAVRPGAAPLLLLLAAGAWIGLVGIGHGMGSMPGTMGYGAVVFVAVWVLMTAAMMLPSVAPFASVYGRTFGDRRASRHAAFGAGYLIVWAAAALPAYAVARLADDLVAHHPAGATALAVVTFAACGVYQLTPLKDRCLAWCRSPLGFTMKYASYRGRTRDVRVGMHHGAFCLGCCWALMVLLFAFGLMNLVAMALLAALIGAERMTVWGPRLGRVVGVAALALAVAVVFTPGLAPALHQSPDTMTNGHMHEMGMR